MQKRSGLLFGLIALALLTFTNQTAWARDSCADPNAIHTPVVVSISSATTTELVAASANVAGLNLCGCDLVATGTSPTIQFKYGTKVTNPCDTNPANMTGAMAPAAGQPVPIGGSYLAAFSPAGNEICITTGGTSNVQGVCTYSTP